MFLNTERFAVLMGVPRSVLRPTPANGVPTTAAAIGSLWIQCAPGIGVTAHGVVPALLPKQGSVKLTRVPKGIAAPAGFKHVAVVPSQYCPTELIGRLALLRIGRHASYLPPQFPPGSQRLPLL